jgi:tripartite-type tricarboxylate transporter receptor subunit TctC
MKAWKARDACPSGAQEDGRALGRRALLGAAAGAFAAPSVLAQPGAGARPHDRVTIVTSLPAGSTVDVTTRVFADWLAQVWGKPIVIDNRGGANGVVACEMVARARPDGLTLLSTSAMTHAANPALYERLSYDPIRDFAAIGRYNTSPFVVMAHKGLGAASLPDLIALLKAEPGRHNFGAGSVPSRIASELLRQIAGLDLVHVGYRGNQQAFPDLTNGRISLMAVDVVGAKPLVDRDAVHAVALSDAVRHPAVPGVPTGAEAGLPEYRFVTWSGLYAPASTPPAIVDRIARDLEQAAEDPEVKARLDALGSANRVPMVAAEFAAFTASEMENWGRIIRQAGLKPE